MGAPELLVLPEAPEPLGAPLGFDLMTGSVLEDGRYQIIGPLGAGPSGLGARRSRDPSLSIPERNALAHGTKVYSAQDWETGDSVVVKMFDDTLGKYSRSQNTSEMAAGILLASETGFVTPIALGTEDVDGVPRRFQVTKYQSDGTLAEKMIRDGVLSATEALVAAAAIAKRAAVMHRMGLLHRDIKLANIYPIATGNTHLLGDFGITERYVDEPTSEMLEHIPSLELWRQVGKMQKPEGVFDASLGTAPPDRFSTRLQQNPNPNEDAFSIASSVVFAVLERYPFGEFAKGDAARYVETLIDEGPVPITELVERGIKLDKAQVLARALRIDREKRASVDDLSSLAVAA